MKQVRVAANCSECREVTARMRKAVKMPELIYAYV